MKYSEAIRRAILDSMASDEKMIVLGQGVWSPFYVGQTMDGIESEFGRDRVIDTPVSENAVTGIALGAALAGSPALVIHPRMDFMILAMDPIVNAASKWRYALDWQGAIPLTIRSIINRGGEQGAQHSQSLQSWFSHIPGLRVVMPSNSRDAYYLLRSCIQSPDPCLFIEDRWNYNLEQEFDLSSLVPLINTVLPSVVRQGSDVTIVAYGNAVNQCLEATIALEKHGISGEVIDLRILNPLNLGVVHESVAKTGKIIVIEETWPNCSVGASILAEVFEKCFDFIRKPPARMNLAATPAPTSSYLEEFYYFSVKDIIQEIINLCKNSV